MLHFSAVSAFFPLRLNVLCCFSVFCDPHFVFTLWFLVLQVSIFSHFFMS